MATDPPDAPAGEAAKTGFGTGGSRAAAVPTDLLDHLLACYHAAIRERLPVLVYLACNLERAHAGDVGFPHGLALYLDTLQRVMESQVRKEEQFLFPLLRSGAGPKVRGAITVMRMEHHWQRAALQRIDELTGGIRPPPGCGRVWRRLYTELAQLRDDLIRHIRLENDVLFESALGAVRRPDGGCR
jgi:regulator of cell morphogenesis and NO signaling